MSDLIKITVSKASKLKGKQLNTYYEKLDVKSLNTFLRVMELGSVSKAAKSLGVSQSNVSYVIDNLRLIFDDELFIRNKKGVLPTNFALSIHSKVSDIVEGLHELSLPNTFSPESTDCALAVGMSTCINDSFIPVFLQRISGDVNSIYLALNNDSPSTDHDLRTGKLDLCLSTFHNVNDGDIVQKRIAESRIVCFYDPDARQAPDSLAELQDAQYVGITCDESKAPADVIDYHYQMPFKREFALCVQNVHFIQSLVKGSDRLVVGLQLLAKDSLKGLAYVDLPFDLKPTPIYMMWHKRQHNNPQHKWLRDQLQATAQELLTDTVDASGTVAH